MLLLQQHGFFKEELQFNWNGVLSEENQIRGDLNPTIIIYVFWELVFFFCDISLQGQQLLEELAQCYSALSNEMSKPACLITT